MRTTETSPLLGGNDYDGSEGHLLHPDPLCDYISGVYNHIQKVTIKKTEYATTAFIESVVIEFSPECHDKNFELHIRMDKGRTWIERVQL
jgi:hypothetical protein